MYIVDEQKFVIRCELEMSRPRPSDLGVEPCLFGGFQGQWGWMMGREVNWRGEEERRGSGGCSFSGVMEMGFSS